jgi:hypothetical protein
MSRRVLSVLVAMSLCVKTLSTIGSAWDDIYPDIHVEGQVREQPLLHAAAPSCSCSDADHGSGAKRLVVLR